MIIKGKDLIERISDKEYSEELLKELEKYEVKKPKSVWELKEGDVFWRVDFINGKFEFYESVWGWLSETVIVLKLAHLTAERAELHARVLNTELAIKKWKRENDNVEFDWEDENQRKYYLMYNDERYDIAADWWGRLKLANTIYFSSRKKLEQFVKDVGKERIIEWLKWEDNDQ